MFFFDVSPTIPHVTEVEAIIDGVHATGVTGGAVTGGGKPPGVGVTGGSGGYKLPRVSDVSGEALPDLSLTALSLTARKDAC